jgi:hypothetical protein
MRGLFPIWKNNPGKLDHTFVGLGFKAVITCVDSTILDKNLVASSLIGNFCPNYHPPLILAVKTVNSILLYMTDRYSEKEYCSRKGKSS